MIFRILFKFFRYVLTTSLLVLLLFCIVFAVLQSKWGKQQMRNALCSWLHEAGVTAHIVDLNGQPPFNWTIRKANLDFGQDRTLKLSDLRFRIAFFPLLKGKFSINYLKVTEAKYQYPADHKTSFGNLDAAKAMLRQQLETIHLPFPVALRHFAIDRLEIAESGSGTLLTFGISGRASVRQDLQEFSLASHVFSPDQNTTWAEATLVGNQSKDSIAAEVKIRLDSLPPSLMHWGDAGFSSDLSIQGPWSTFHEILHDLPVSKDPIRGYLRAAISQTKIPAAPLLSCDWKFKTRFLIPSADMARIEHFHLSGNLLHIKGKGELHKDPLKNRARIAFSAPDLSLLSGLAHFSLSGSAQGKASFQEGSFKAFLEADGLTLDKFAARTTRVDLKGSVEEKFYEAEATLSSKDAAIPFESKCALEWIPSNLLSITDFSCQMPTASLSGFMNYDFPDQLLEGALFAEARDLNPFGFLIGDEYLNGTLQAELNLSTQQKGQEATGALIAQNLRLRDIFIQSLSAGGTIEDFTEAPKGRMNLLAEKVYTPGISLEQLTFGTHSDEIHWPFFLNARGKIESPFTLDAQGFWQKDNSLFTLELTRLTGDIATVPLALERPTELEWGTNSLSLSPFNLKVGAGHFYSLFDFSSMRSVGKWDLRHFPLEIFGCLRPRFTLSGFVTTSGFFDATPNRIEGTLGAVLEEAGVFHPGKKEPLRAKGSLQIHLSGNRMQVQTDLKASDAQFLDLTASLPTTCQLYPFRLAPDPTRNISAELIAEGKLQDLFDFVNMGGNHVTGLLSCRLFLSRTLHSPSLQGELTWQKGTFENYLAGISLRNIEAQCQAQGDKIELLSLQAGDDRSGSGTATGKIQLKPRQHFPWVFATEMHKLHGLSFDMIDCDLTGPMYLTGDTQNMNILGNLLIDDAKIQITERLPYEAPSLPVTWINRPPHLFTKTTPISPEFAFHIDLELTAEKNVRVKGRGLDAELEGNVHLQGTDASIAAEGSLKLIKGEYIFSGKVFKLTEGEITFSDKPTPSAWLNLSGDLSLPDITITALLRGPLTSPQLTFQSNPQKPTSSLLALILFNKDITEISHPEAIQLASTLVSLSGGAGPDVLDSIRRSIGVDRLNIASKPGTDELAVQIGKYLTRGVLITLSQSATSSQVIVEVELPKDFIFQAETQEEEEGKFSLKWRKSY